MYEASEPKGCYFCDRSIDGNEIPFEYPNETRLCLSCMLKVANLMKAFGIDPQSLFPGLVDRKIQVSMLRSGSRNADGLRLVMRQ